ncbi:uncharacterized protein ASCRUDRAFT_76455 [Ascoidea rubescens DSM 1968]|uniref:P-loop containing nucleoside triphosphate hydrolase protein n=1 Tax=Ascoidea rubescens DSM 1968 TaxID=1344418 RepID=A0A1D2VFN2_9ASCO|nr:hypothetical protein ASCRUDRAFT_76455 [Ascoidea rubescens DSM 1968]ODV60478.1 hypothetical protein ASCRUDRAFT_76455 [Ascoidea rubescens DSM 1968]
MFVDKSNGLVFVHPTVFESNSSSLFSCPTSLYQIIVPTNENALNPCFLLNFQVYFDVLFALFSFIQFVKLVTSSQKLKLKYGNIPNYNISLNLKDIGFAQFLKIILVLAQSFFGFLVFHSSADLTFTSFLSLFLYLFFFALPLHIIEYYQSTVPSSSLLLYWLINSIYLLIFPIQRFYTKWPIIYPYDYHLINIHNLEIFMATNSLIIFVLELLFWRPYYKLIQFHHLNQLEVNNIHIFSRLSYSWMNPLIITGYNQTLSHDDLPPCPENIKCQVSTSHFKNNLNKQFTKNHNNKSINFSKFIFDTVGIDVILVSMLQFINVTVSFIQPQLFRLFMAFFLKRKVSIIYNQFAFDFSQDINQNLNNEAQDDQGLPIIAGVLITIGMLCVSLITTILSNQYFYNIFQVGFKIRSGLSGLIYDKALRLAPNNDKIKKSSEIVNLVSVDLSRIQMFVLRMEVLISAPLQFILCMISLYDLMGNSVFVGLLLVLFIGPFNGVLIAGFRKLFEKNMKNKDLRTKKVTEILSSIKSIKLYSWELPMLENLKNVRNNMELKTLRKIGVFASLLEFSWSCFPYFVSCISFGFFYYFKGEKLTSDIIFPALSLFQILRGSLFMLPAIITALMQVSVSVKRVSEFLVSEETDPDLIVKLSRVNHSGEVSVEITNGTFLFNNNQSKDNNNNNNNNKTDNVQENNTSNNGKNIKKKVDDEEAQLLENTIPERKVALSDINFTARKGDLTCIVGRVGSGKSSFLKAILGQLPMDKNQNTDSRLVINGSVAYCSQVPWIMNSTIKQNILFGHKYEEDFYQQTIKSCELLSDLKTFPDGDETQVGEKGISLSGGQKARISLARAVYSRSDIILLDDVLSAVDAHVGRKLIEQIFSSKGLLNTKTIILSTNNIKVLREAKCIYFLKGGKIVQFGDYNSLVESGREFFDLIQNSDFSSSAKEDVFQSNLKTSDTDEEIDSTDEPFGEEIRRIPTTVTVRRASVATIKRESKSGQIDETSQKGKVKLSTYIAYAKAASYSGTFLTIFSCIMTVVIDLFSKLWLKKWAELGDSGDSDESNLFLVFIYTLLGFCSGLNIFIGSLILWYISAINAARKLHDDMANSILHSPMYFFESNPIGRILNRFTEDINKIDEVIPRSFESFFVCFIGAVFILGVIGFNLPSTLIFMGVLSLVYYYYQIYYIATSRETKRLSSTSRSPIYSHMQESLDGLETIRAFNQEKRFIILNNLNLDYNLRAAYSQLSVSRWLDFRLNVLGAMIIFMTAITSVLSPSKRLGAGLVGILMTYALQITNTLNYLVKTVVELETNCVAIERVLEYSRLPSEAPYIIEGNRPPSNWPEKGEIKFQNYTTKYRENLEPVLKEITIDIKAQEKVGIVGRTGAGKSTLTLALFRILEANGGSILIDGIDIKTLGLYDLRSRLNIIPQDSQAFEGSIRQNLDPFNKHSDEELWKALELAHLKEHVLTMGTDKPENGDNGNPFNETTIITNGDSSTDANTNNSGNRDDDPSENNGKGLMAKVTENGKNLSVGQKQLLCLARSLLSSSKILILDEATAAVDVQTDKIVQETIRKEFRDKTILTIAHRINTVIDNDKILVLENGAVKEFDSPNNLLNNKDSLFYSLYQENQKSEQ